MARVVETLPESERAVPILSSPRLGVARVAELLAQVRERPLPAQVG